MNRLRLSLSSRLAAWLGLLGFLFHTLLPAPAMLSHARGSIIFPRNVHGDLLEVRQTTSAILAGTTSPGGRTVASAYSNRGLLASVTEPSLQRTELAYDGRGRVQTRTGKLANGTVEHTQGFGYDANSNLLTVTEGAAVLSRSYDDLNRIGTYGNAAGEALGYQYDANGNLTKLTYPDGKTVTYIYDSRDRLVSATDWAGRLTMFTWDADSRLTLLVRGRLAR